MELSVYLGRMPIMNGSGEVFAYELLHRSTDANHTLVDDNIKATARVLVNALNYIGLKSLTELKPAFIKVDEKAIFDDLIYSISEKHFILEILEDSIIDDALIKRIQTLHSKGYQFAINHYKSDEDFVYSVQKVFPYVSYVKIDIRHNARDTVLQMLEYLQGLDLLCIAEKVEDEEDYEWARQQRFHFFEGYYFSKPKLYIREMIDPDIHLLLNLLYLLKRDASLEEILEIFNTTPYLSINLLKFIHMHHGNSVEKISSIDQALIILGREKLGHWVELMIYAQRDTKIKGENITATLGKIAKSRASLMYELALATPRSSGENFTASAYLVGVLSLSEAIFQSSYETIFSQMDLEDRIREAITEKKGVLGNLLQLCLAVERNSFSEISTLLQSLNISQEALNKAMILAYQRASREL